MLTLTPTHDVRIFMASPPCQTFLRFNRIFLLSGGSRPVKGWILDSSLTAGRTCCFPRMTWGFPMWPFRCLVLTGRLFISLFLCFWRYSSSVLSTCTMETCVFEDTDDFIITSLCSVGGLIKNMWLCSPCTLTVDRASNVLPFVCLCVCVCSGGLSYCSLGLTWFVRRLACFNTSVLLAWTRLLTCSLNPVVPNVKHISRFMTF